MSLTLAMSVPFGIDDGTPVQFAAAIGREDPLFCLAGQIEPARHWAGRRPSPHISAKERFE